MNNIELKVIQRLTKGKSELLLKRPGRLRNAVRKKRDYVGKIPKLGGGSLTQTHFLMSTFTTQKL